MRFNGKTIVVTGGGSGIGQQLVLGLLARGARVAATDIRQDGLDETAELAKAGDRLAILTADVTNREAIHALPAKVVEIHGSVDGYISNAGIIQPFVKLNDMEYADIERVINVNLYGTIHMAKAFLPLLLERPEAHITNVASMGAFLPWPGQTVYGAAKAGVKLLTEGLYAEMLGTNVGVTLVMPGPVGSNIAENSGVDVPVDPESVDPDQFNLVSAEDAAQTILEGIEKDKFHVLIGRTAKMMNLMTRIAPKRATHLITKQMKDLLG